MKLYNSKLDDLVRMLGDRATDNVELDSLGRHMFGAKYHGTYSSDRLPTLSNSSPYCIVNVDKSNANGSHWVACALAGDDVYIYDSFGRSTSTLIPSIVAKYGGSRVKDADYDAEQLYSQKTCGHRCLSFINVCDKLGVGYAQFI